MALHHDLLDQARRLAHNEPRRPKQASLRRAVSAAYYSLFHFLTGQAAAALVSGRAPHRRSLRASVRRCFDHAQMRTASRRVADGRGRWHAAIDAPASGALRLVASTVTELQEERHRADYDHEYAVLRDDVEMIIADVENAKAAWESIRGTPEADAYLVAVLLRFRS